MSDTKPRAHTVDEMRAMVLDHLREMAHYWATTSLDQPELRAGIDAKGETLYRLEGLVFSILVMLDGGTMATPAFDLAPRPHPSDEQYHRGNRENWWPPGEVINDCQLHELWSMRGDK